MVDTIKAKRVDTALVLDPFLTEGLSDPEIELLDWAMSRVYPGGPIAFWTVTPISSPAGRTTSPRVRARLQARRGVVQRQHGQGSVHQDGGGLHQDRAGRGRENGARTESRADRGRWIAEADRDDAAGRFADRQRRPAHENLRSIDVHAHYFDPAYVDLLERNGADPRVVFDARAVVALPENLEIARRIGIMDGSGVQRQVLSMSAVSPYLNGAAAAVEAARRINDLHAATVQKHPDRFGFFAALPMPHVDAALAELARAFEELPAAGVTFTTSINGRSLADPEFEPVFAELDRRAAVVFLHPPGFACDRARSRRAA